MNDSPDYQIVRGARTYLSFLRTEDVPWVRVTIEAPVCHGHKLRLQSYDFQFGPAGTANVRRVKQVKLAQCPVCFKMYWQQ